MTTTPGSPVGLPAPVRCPLGAWAPGPAAGGWLPAHRQACRCFTSREWTHVVQAGPCGSNPCGLKAVAGDGTDWLLHSLGRGFCAPSTHLWSWGSADPRIA